MTRKEKKLEADKKRQKYIDLVIKCVVKLNADKTLSLYEQNEKLNRKISYWIAQSPQESAIVKEAVDIVNRKAREWKGRE